MDKESGPEAEQFEGYVVQAIVEALPDWRIFQEGTNGRFRPDLVVEKGNLTLIFDVRFLRRQLVEESLVQDASRASQLRRSLPDRESVRVVLILAAEEFESASRSNSEMSPSEAIANFSRRLTAKAGYDAVILTPLRFGAAVSRIEVRSARGLPPTAGTLNSAIHYIAAESASLLQAKDGRKEATGRTPPSSRQKSRDLRRFLLVTDEWNSGKGGISSFNRELAGALIRAGREVCVYLPSITEDDLTEATSLGIDIAVPSSVVPGLTGAAGLLAHQIRHLSKERYRPDVIVGHGRVLGPHAYFIQGLYSALRPLRVHIVHTNAELLELSKEGDTGEPRTRLAADRRRLELELARSADVVGAVGPLLHASISDDLTAEGSVTPTVQLDPGLRDWGGPRDHTIVPAVREFLLLGRMEDFWSKGVELAIRAVGIAAARSSGLVQIQLALRGVPREHAELREQVQKIADEYGLEVVLREYSTNVAEMRSDVRKAIAVLMPSRHEGFGLAAYEAIAMGTPVIISHESGLALFLAQLANDAKIRQAPASISATGPNRFEDWATEVERVLHDPGSALRRAATLRQDLSALNLWPKSIAGLEAALDSVS